MELSSDGLLSDDVTSAETSKGARIDEIRRQIENDAYETPEKLDVVVSRLVEELRSGGG